VHIVLSAVAVADVDTVADTAAAAAAAVDAAALQQRVQPLPADAGRSEHRFDLHLPD